MPKKNLLLFIVVTAFLLGVSALRHSVTLPGLGTATTALRSDGPEVRVPLGAGRWVRVRGTVPLSELVSYARRLTAARGP